MHKSPVKGPNYEGQPDDCPGGGQLVAFLSGHSSQAQAEAVYRHLETCPACESRLIDLDSRSKALTTPLQAAPAGWHLTEEPECQRMQEVAKRIPAIVRRSHVGDSDTPDGATPTTLETGDDTSRLQLSET